VDTAVRLNKSFEARELAIREVHGRPGILQRELAERLHAATGLAASTSVGLLRSLEREGRLEGRLVGRRKVYRPALPRGRAWEPVAVLLSLLALAGLAVAFLTPARHSFDGVSTDPARVQLAPPVKRASAELSRARVTPAAVLSAVDVPRIAARTGVRLRQRGFRISAVADAPAPRARSVVLYARGAALPAGVLARSLGIRATAPLDSATQAVAPAARLAVVLGADRR
jgi:hypothetical protein